MKKLRIKLISTLFFCLTILTFSSCLKHDDLVVKSSDLLGTWRLSELQLSGSDEWIDTSVDDGLSQIFMNFISDHNANVCIIDNGGDPNLFPIHQICLCNAKKNILIFKDASNAIILKLMVTRITKNEIIIDNFPIGNSVNTVVFKRC